MITIEEFLSRGVERVFPNTEYVAARLKEGGPLSMYLGIDPTAPTLHLGHMTILKKLRDFQRLGFEPVLLIGDFTAMIGDPTGKLNTRKQLTHEEVLANCAVYKEQASKFISFEGKNKARLVFNSTWLKEMKFDEVLKLASHMTVDYMLKRDMFDERMKAGQPIFIHEFLYPLLQGYDSVAMDIDGEIGGNDQTFNMLAGRHLLKALKNKEKFVIAQKLLVDSNGRKMGKTEGNMVRLDQDAASVYGAVMSWPDTIMVNAFELCTDVSVAEYKAIEKDLAAGVAHPRDVKMRLAREITTLIHNAAAATEAEKIFIDTFKNNEVPENIPVVSVDAQKPLVDILLAEKIVQSKSEWRRLVEEGAVGYLHGDTVTDASATATHNGTLRIGKRRFITISIR
jgi:tyrosyl-tRNA synthetase